MAGMVMKTPGPKAPSFGKKPKIGKPMLKRPTMKKPKM
jgi:hypothetical protein